jgi:predicted alpha/beta-fold hydrolase
MPVVKHSDYQPPLWLPNGHFQTIYPSLFRKVDGISYQRVRLSTPDHDFWTWIGQKLILMKLIHSAHF